MPEKIPYIEEILDWFPFRGGSTALKLHPETLEGGDYRIFSFTVYPYLEEKLPPEIYREYHKQKVQALVSCNSEAFLDACIENFLGESHKASQEKKLIFLTKLRDYLFQGEKVKPRIIAPDKRRTNVTHKN